MEQAKSTVHVEEIGQTGLRRAGGYVFDMEVEQLRGAVWRDTIAEMMLDPVVGAILFAVDILLRGVSWRVDPASKDQEDERTAAFVKSCLDDMSFTWVDTVSEILTMLPYGWSWFETVYKRRHGDRITSFIDSMGREQETATSNFDDGLIGWRKWGIRSQDSLHEWQFDYNGGVQGMFQLAAPDYTRRFIPIRKSILFRTSVHKNNPEGKSILYSAFEPWYYKSRIQRFEAIGVERDLAGLPIVYVPPDWTLSTASADERALYAQMKRIATQTKRDEFEGAVMPAMFDEFGNRLLEMVLLGTGGSRQFDIDRIVARYDQRIAMAVLADFILLGHENVGSYSLSENKSDLFTAGLKAWVDSICSTINRYAIPRLLKLNGFAGKMPKIAAGKVTGVDLKELGEFLSTMSGASIIVPDAKLEEYVRQQANLPAAAPDGDDRVRLPGLNGLLGGLGGGGASQYSERESGAMLAAAERVLLRGKA